MPVSPGVWTLPAGSAIDPGLEQAAELCREGGGTFALIDASPRDGSSTAMLSEAYRSVRLDEWAEFMADCGKFEQEIAREIHKQKFTFAELEEEEQSLTRLRRWFRDLKKRDVLALPEAREAEERLGACTLYLDGYAEQVYATVQASMGPAANRGPADEDTP